MARIPSPLEEGSFRPHPRGAPPPDRVSGLAGKEDRSTCERRFSYAFSRASSPAESPAAPSFLARFQDVLTRLLGFATWENLGTEKGTRPSRQATAGSLRSETRETPYGATGGRPPAMQS